MLLDALLLLLHGVKSDHSTPIGHSRSAVGHSLGAGRWAVEGLQCLLDDWCLYVLVLIGLDSSVAVTVGREAWP